MIHVLTTRKINLIHNNKSIINSVKLFKEKSFRIFVSNHNNHSIEIISNNNYSYKFSKGLLAHSLKSKGVQLDLAYQIIQKVYNSLVEKKLEKISETDLRNHIKRTAFEITGESIDELFDLVETWHDTSLPLIILLSGARGLDKAEIGSRLASRFAIPKIISTPTVVQILKKMITSDLAPELHEKSYVAYKKLRPIYSISQDEVLIGYEEHSKYPAEAVEALVKRGINESQSMIIRGEHLLPRFLSDKLINHPSILYITLYLPDEEKHRERYLQKYEDDELIYREKHFPAVRKIHNYLIDQANARELTTVEVTDINCAIDDIEEIILCRLRKMIRDGKINYEFHSYDQAIINS